MPVFDDRGAEEGGCLVQKLRLPIFVVAIWNYGHCASFVIPD